MKVKLRFLCDKLDSSQTLIDIGKLQLGTSVYTNKFPLTKDIGILTILEDMELGKNQFQICVKDSKEEVLGKGEIFSSKLISKETNEGIVIYNINNAYFENHNDFYMIELWNDKKLVDKFKLNAEVNIYEIYQNLDDRGVISLL